MSREFSLDELLQGVLMETTECLSLEPGEATPHSKFFTELGGESIEILQLSFQIKKRFNIETHFHSLPALWEFDSAGQITAESVAQLCSRFPTIDWNGRISGLHGANAIELITLELIAERIYCEQSKPAKGLAVRSTSQ